MVSALVLPSLVVALLSALEIVIKKHLVKDLSHNMMVVIGAILYFTFSLIYMGFNRDKIQEEFKTVGLHIILFMIAATFFGFLANILYLNMMRSGQISLVTALTSTVPFFVTALAVLILNESIGPRHIAGIGAIVAGTFLLS